MTINIQSLTTCNNRCPAHDAHLYETVNDLKPVEKAIKERNFHPSTDKQNEHDYRDGSLTPPLPPRTYSYSSSLDKIDNLEKHQHLSIENVCPKMDNENTYQPLIPPRSSNATTTTEYQSLMQLKQSEAKF